MEWRYGISYDRTKNAWSVRQEITKISLYDLEGDLDEVADFLIKQKRSLTKLYVKQPQTLKAAYFIEAKPGRSPDQGSASDYFNREVQFDKLELEWGVEYDEKVLKVFGTRKPDAEELAALEADQQQRIDDQTKRDLEAFEALKKKLGK